jgi:VCBS repeat-containing protein
MDLDAEFVPVGLPDDYVTDEDIELVIGAPGLLVNDADANGDAITAILDIDGNFGVATVAPDGSFTYMPNPNANGVDSFTYVVDDGNQASPPVTVTVTVMAVNDPPVPAPGAYPTDEDVALVVAAPGVLAGDTDVDGDVLTAVLVADPSNGVLSLDDDGGFTYTPRLNFNGVDSFIYAVDDGVATVPMTIDLTIAAINDAPTAVGHNYAADEDTRLSVAPPGVLAGAVDVEGDVLTAVLVAAPATGTLLLQPNGSFEYTPAPDSGAADSFTYQVDDGQALSAVQTVDLVVNAVNDAPVAYPDFYEIDEDSALSVLGVFGVRANDFDPDDALGSLTVLQVGAPANGTLTLQGNGAFDYTPHPDFNGLDSFSYRLTDPPPDSLSSDVAVVTIEVHPVNEVPVAVDDVYLAPGGGPLVVDAGSGVLYNDTDADGDPLTATLVAPPVGGRVMLTASGAFTYEPEAGFSGTDTFTYRASDAESSAIASVEIAVPGGGETDTGLTTPTDPDDCVVRTFYRDADGDGWGDPDSAYDSCDPSPKDIERGRDCDDANAAVHPGASEIASDGVDQDCDGSDSAISAVGTCEHSGGGGGFLVLFAACAIRRGGDR